MQQFEAFFIADQEQTQHKHLATGDLDNQNMCPDTAILPNGGKGKKY